MLKSGFLPLLSHSPSYSPDSQDLVSAKLQIHWFPSFQHFFPFCLFVCLFGLFCLVLFPFFFGGESVGCWRLSVYFLVILFGLFVLIFFWEFHSNVGCFRDQALTQKKEHCIWTEIHYDFDREEIRFFLKKWVEIFWVAPVEVGANLFYFRRLTIKGLDGELANVSVALRFSGHIQ